MGVGYAEDLVVSVALGADMFDCVYPTRTARFGTALTRHGVLNVKLLEYKNDPRPLEEGCKCPVCKPKEEGGMGVSRGTIRLMATRDTVGAHLLTIHNTWYQLELMRTIRQSIVEDRFEEFVQTFFKNKFGDDTPTWAREALAKVNIRI